MALRTDLDRAVETATITGTGAYTLAGAVAGFITLAAAGMANGDTAELLVEAIDSNGVPSGGWELGLYTWNTGPTLSRTTIRKSSNAGSAVSWGASTLVRISSTVSSYTLKHITSRVLSEAFSATPTINTDNYDEYHATAMSGAITSMTTNLTGTPVSGDILICEFTDNGTARAIAWGTSFESSTVTLPTTTVISALLTVTLKWNAATSKWRCVGVA